jgi:thiol-disulfide isomerase/thioredoxin
MTKRYFCIVTIAAVVLAGLVGVAIAAELGELTRGPGQTIELTDDNFDSVVFPEDSKTPPIPFIIFFYAPWCNHCKMAKPYYYNASEFLMSSPDYSKRSALFALVDATSSKVVSARYNIRSYPTILYTVRSSVYRYEGGRGINDYAQFATYLFYGARLGSFADDVSDPVRFEQVDVEAPGRAAFLVYIPRTAVPGVQRNGPVDGVVAPWLQVVESLISIGKTRYAVIFEEKIPKQVAGNHELFSQVGDVAKKASRHQRGPSGEVLVLLSDAYDGPQVYSGPWEADDAPDGSGQFRIHKLLRKWVDENAFLAVEAITFETYPILGMRSGLMAILALNGPLGDSDVSMLPALRHIVRTRNSKRLAAALAAEAGIISQPPTATSSRMNFTFATIDCMKFLLWCEQYGLNPREYPTFVAVNIKSEVVFHSKALFPELHLKLREVPWKIGGQQAELITRFLEAVEQGEVTGDRTTTIGRAAEFLLRIPLMSYFYSLAGDDDTTFLSLLGLFVFISFVLFIATRSDPSPAGKPERKTMKTD